MRTRIVMLLVAVASVASFGLLRPEVANAAFPGAAGLIAYVDTGLDDAPVIAVIAVGGSSSEQLTTTAQSPFGDAQPSWSPGGRFLVFKRLTSVGTGEIWRMNANGTGQSRLTRNSANDTAPAWSADGSRIVFSSNRSGNYEIYSMSPTGGSLRRLTNSAGRDVDPVWSPLNDRIAFSSDRRGKAAELYTMKVDGSDVKRITSNPFSAPHEQVAPDWSPDASRLTFTWMGAVASIMYMTPSSPLGPLTELPGDNARNTRQVFAPDADPVATGRFLYQTDRAGSMDIVLQKLDESGASFEPGYIDRDERDPDWQPIPVFPLVDARFSSFRSDIEFVFGAGITVGCSVERYCPNDVVTRGQMATFLDRALSLPPTTTDYFTDDDGSYHEDSINRLRSAGITSGCGGTDFCPYATVTREQMATFLTKAFSLPTATTDYFTDDETSSHEGSINRIRAAGITTGCGGTKFCPKVTVTRGQMAAFLHRAMD